MISRLSQMRTLSLIVTFAAIAGLAAAPQATPTPSPTFTPVPGSLANPTPSPSATATPFSTPTPMFSPTPTPTATATPSPTPFESPTATPTPISGPSPSPTPGMIAAALPRMFAQSTTPSGQPQQGERPTLNRPSTQPPAVPPTTAPAPSAPAPAQPTPNSAPAPARDDSSSEAAKPSYPDLLPRFDYDTKTGLELRNINIEKRGDTMLIEINYAGANGDRVPGYLVIPHGGGDHPAIIWGHWLKQGSPLANKDEFLDEALVLAHAGVLSLLIDAPQARHDFGPIEKDPLAAARQQGDATVHQVIDLRRAVDLLRLRRDVDPKRIAYVGHSWDAHVGAIFAGVESRVCCFVLMASGYFLEEDIFASHDPQTVARVKEIGAEQVRDYFHDYAADDPVYFLGHTTSESIFLQFSAADLASQSGAADAKARAQKYLDAFSSRDKQMTIYDAPHALNSAARLDRIRWLQKRLDFKKVDEKELEAVPQLK